MTHTDAVVIEPAGFVAAASTREGELAEIRGAIQ
jgi:hypothetical protein